MSLLVMDVHGLVDYSNAKKEPIFPLLLDWVRRQKREENLRIMFWTAGSQSDGEKYLKKYGVLEGNRRFSIGWENWVDELNEMQPYKCIGSDSIDYLQRRIEKGDIKGVTRVMQILGVTEKVDDFTSSFRNWLEKYVFERPKKNPRIFANKEDTSVILIESDGARFDMYGNPQPNKAVVENLISNASRYNYDLILTPERSLWNHTEMPFSQMDVGISLRNAINICTIPEKRAELIPPKGLIYDIGNLKGLYEATTKAKTEFENGKIVPNKLDDNSTTI